MAESIELKDVFKTNLYPEMGKCRRCWCVIFLYLLLTNDRVFRVWETFASTRVKAGV